MRVQRAMRQNGVAEIVEACPGRILQRPVASESAESGLAVGPATSKHQQGTDEVLAAVSAGHSGIADVAGVEGATPGQILRVPTKSKLHRIVETRAIQLVAAVVYGLEI